jgi:aerobic carbon-monoxide dehydrogenase medium subunit
VKPPPFEYHAPVTLEDACTLLATLDNAKVLAGGQSLMPMLNMRFAFPDHLIDVNRIPHLDGIVADRNRVSIGAMVRQRALEVDSQLARVAPIFSEALPLVGHRQTRNRGTIGGSLCQLDPAAELPLLALVHDATIRIASAGGGQRSVPMAQFIGGYMSPTIAQDELVVGIDILPWAVGHGYAFCEHARRHGDFALAAVACLLELDDGLRVIRAAIGVGGIGSVAVRLTIAESMLVGFAVDPEIAAEAARHCADLEAVSDMHGQGAYRTSIAAALVRRAILSAFGRARAGRAG